MKEATVLVVEDSVVTSVAVGRVIEQALPNCRILRAQSCFEAQLLMRIYNFSLVVLDIHLPDGCGLDLMPALVERNPGTSIIVLTADPQPEYRERSTALGVHHFLEKPFRPHILGDAARDSLTAATHREGETQFKASLRSLSVLEIVQLKCLASASARLEVSDRDYRSGTVCIEDGEIVDAEVHNERTEVLARGAQALRMMLGWRGGTVEEYGARPVAEHTINMPWQALLLEVAQQSDEEANLLEDEAIAAAVCQ